MKILDATGILVDAVSGQPYMNMTIQMPFYKTTEHKSEQENALDFFRAFDRAVTEWQQSNPRPDTSALTE